MFRPHQNLSDEINRNIIRSEIEGGVYLRDLPEAAKLEVQTRNRYYTIVPRSGWLGLDLAAIRNFALNRYWCRSRDPTGAAPCSRLRILAAACIWNSGIRIMKARSSPRRSWISGCCPKRPSAFSRSTPAYRRSENRGGATANVSG